MGAMAQVRFRRIPPFLTNVSWRHAVVMCFDQELTDVHSTSTELQVAICQ